MSDDTPWDLPEPFFVELEAEDETVDRLGHVNNTVYLQWCEQIAWRHAEAAGAGWAAWNELDRAMAVRSVRLDYLVPAQHGDRLLGGNWIVRCDGRLRATRIERSGLAQDRERLFAAPGDGQRVRLQDQPRSSRLESTPTG